MVDIDKLRPEFMNLIANNFRGKMNIHIPINNHFKMICSKLYAEVSPMEIYKTSIKYHIIFDKYETEFIFYTSIRKSLETMIGEFHKKVDKVVIQTFIENGEEERLQSFNFFKDIKPIKFDILDVEKNDTQIL